MPLRVLVAGGGFAGVEALLGLHALAGDRVELTLVCPDPHMRFVPGATGEPFATARAGRWDLASLARKVGAGFRRDAVAAVAGAAHRVRLASGRTVDYDALVLAPGTRRRIGVPGAITFRDERDAHLVRAVVDELRAGAVRSVAFAAPAGVTWPLPLYELAMQAAVVAEEAGGGDIVLATPERSPLEPFGPDVSSQVAEMLAERGVRFLAETQPRSVGHGELRLTFGGTVPAERVVAAPVLSGQRLSGVPATWSGFIATDEHGRVEDLPDVFAAGDITTFPVKQGGIASQQADVVAQVIAAQSGACVEVQPVRHVLRARLLGTQLELNAALDGLGRPLVGGVDRVVETPLPVTTKLFGRYISPWLAATEPVAA